MFKRQRILGSILIAFPLLATGLVFDLCQAEDAALLTPRISVFDGISTQLEPSTVTFRQTTLNLPGSHLANDTVAYSVEASIAPQFTLFQTTFDGPLGGAYRLNVVPKFVLRRSDGLGSNPVRTPSYIPSATLYYSPHDSVAAGTGYWYLSVGLSHYSNGEAGPFLQPDGRTVNDVNGSFSLWSNYAGVHFDNDWPLLPTYKMLQVEYFHHKEGLLEDLYPDYALSVKMQSRDYFLPEGRGPQGSMRGRVRVLTDLIWNVRNPSNLPDAMKPVPFSAALTGAYFPGKMFPELALFGRVYAGFDYYNINFDKEIYRVDIGLMVSPH